MGHIMEPLMDNLMEPLMENLMDRSMDRAINLMGMGINNPITPLIMAL